MPEEKRDWVIGEGNPFPKTPIERWEADIRATKLSRQLEEDGRSATREERGDLVKYSGLGDSAFEQAFSYYGVRDHARQKRRAELEELVSNEQLEGILRHLYPETKVYAAGFQEAPKPDNHFDIAISSVPFGKVKVYDPEFNESSRKFLTGPVHDYYVDNPDRVLGKHSAAGSLYRGREYTLKNDPSIPVVPTLNREMREMAENLGPDALRPQRTVRYEWPEDFSKAQRKRQTERLVLEDGHLRLSDGTSSASQTCRPRKFNG